METELATIHSASNSRDPTTEKRGNCKLTRITANDQSLSPSFGSTAKLAAKRTEREVYWMSSLPPRNFVSRNDAPKSR
jgi:hypothetical protein